jgi:multiple sugar transport system ATP-binding protein
MFVAGFMGSPAMNLFTLPVADGSVSLGGHTLPVPRSVADAAEGSVVVGIRPEHFELGANSAGIELEVDVVEELGSDAYIYGRAVDKGETIVARADWRNPPEKGDRVGLSTSAEHTYFFSAKDGRRLS